MSRSPVTPLLASLAALSSATLLAGCEPSDPTAISGFKPPLAIEGSYTGTVQLTLDGQTASEGMSEGVQLELQAIDSIYNVKGAISVGLLPTGRMEGTYVGRDSSIVVSLLGSPQRSGLGWAAFLPPLLPDCDWSEAEVLEAPTKVDLRQFVLNGRVNTTCTDAALNGTADPALVRITVRMDVHKLEKPGTGS